MSPFADFAKDTLLSNAVFKVWLDFVAREIDEEWPLLINGGGDDGESGSGDTRGSPGEWAKENVGEVGG